MGLNGLLARGLGSVRRCRRSSIVAWFGWIEKEMLAKADQCSVGDSGNGVGFNVASGEHKGEISFSGRSRVVEVDS